MRPNAPTLLQTADAETAAASAAPVAYEGGDDIGRARAFCDRSRIAMDAIIHASRQTDQCEGRCAHFLSEHLCDIQTGAKLARARAVYRSAQDAQAAIQSRGPHLPIDWRRVDGRLLVLNKLLGQFESGVIEMEEAFRARQPESQPNAPLASNDSVRDTLFELLPHAGEGERAALLRLIRWRDRESGPQAMDHSESAEPKVGLSDSMAERIQGWLSLGRDYGKSISVSYGLDEVALTQDACDDLLSRLDARLTDVIMSSMPLQGIGHLDIGADDTALLVTGSGFEPFRVVFDAAKDAHIPTPPRRAMITPDVEAELRAQLGALMEPPEQAQVKAQEPVQEPLQYLGQPELGAIDLAGKA